jgi:hypothetical protein
MNGNVLTGTRSDLEFDVLDLIAGTAIRVNDIYGIMAVTWGANTENRQATFEVNGVASPRFHSSATYDATRIWSVMEHGGYANNGGRTEEQRLTYMNQYGGNPQVANNPATLRPFVDSANPSAFDVRIRTNNEHAAMVTEIVLLDSAGNPLGGAGFSVESNAWTPLFSFIGTCGDCEICEKNNDEIVDIESGLVYTVDGNDATITGFDGNNYPRNVVIPAQIGEYTVREIGAGAFEGTTITSIVIPGGITFIGGFAFAFTAHLDSVIIPNSVVAIEHAAFLGSGIAELTFEAGGEFLGTGIMSFANTPNLTDVTLPAHISSFGASAFQGSGLTNVTFAGNVPTIPVGTFVGTAITREMLPSNATVQEGAVGGVVSVPESGEVVNICICCGKLRYVLVSCDVIGFHVKIAGLVDRTYAGHITIPSQINGINVTMVGDSAFQGTAITSIYIPNSVTRIASVAFDNITITSVVFESLNPPIFGSSYGSVFGNIIRHHIKNRITIYVPIDSLERYQNESQLWWFSQFNLVVGYAVENGEKMLFCICGERSGECGCDLCSDCNQLNCEQSYICPVSGTCFCKCCNCWIGQRYGFHACHCCPGCARPTCVCARCQRCGLHPSSCFCCLVCQTPKWAGRDSHCENCCTTCGEHIEICAMNDLCCHGCNKFRHNCECMCFCGSQGLPCPHCCAICEENKGVCAFWEKCCFVCESLKANCTCTCEHCKNPGCEGQTHRCCQHCGREAIEGHRCPGNIVEERDTPPTVQDALAILRHIVGLSSRVGEAGSATWYAAIIHTNSTEPSAQDALQILRWLVGLESNGRILETAWEGR